MTDEQIIVKAESLGFKFHKHKDSWRWTVITPNRKDSVICEQGDPEGMRWLREKITYFM